MNIFGLTDIGAVRKDNQDSYAIRVLADDLAVAVVCDGMGGAQAGNVASAVAVEVFCAAVEDACKGGVPKDTQSRQEILMEACRKANRQVFERSVSAIEYQGMGTTLVAALIFSDEIHVANVGDSRCYLIDEGGAHQVTLDHSVVQVLVERGDITPEEARVHPKKNLITRALGVDDHVVSDHYRVPHTENNWMLLCSDGLSNVLPDDVLHSEIARAETPEECARRLLAMTLEQGAPDNVTIVLAQL